MSIICVSTIYVSTSKTHNSLYCCYRLLSLRGIGKLPPTVWKCLPNALHRILILHYFTPVVRICGQIHSLISRSALLPIVNFCSLQSVLSISFLHINFISTVLLCLSMSLIMLWNSSPELQGNISVRARQCYKGGKAMSSANHKMSGYPPIKRHQRGTLNQVRLIGQHHLTGSMSFLLKTTLW